MDDESLRSRLTDDEYQLVLDWALVKVSQSAGGCASAPVPSDAACFTRSSDQLVALVRHIDLTVGERANVAPSVLAARLRLVEAAVEPPLFEHHTIVYRRERLDALRLESSEWLQTADNRDLILHLMKALN